MKYIFLFIFITWSKIDFAQEQQKAEDLLKIDYTWGSKMVTGIPYKKCLVSVDVYESLYFLERLNKNDVSNLKWITYLDFDSLCTIPANFVLIEEKLMNIFQNKLTYDEILKKWEAIKNANKSKFDDSVILNVIKRNYKLLKYKYWEAYNLIFDSIAKPLKVELENDILKKTVNDYTILLSAWIKSKKCSTFLEKVYKENDPRFNRRTIETALIKFGNVNLRDIFFKTIFQEYIIGKNYSSTIGLCSSPLFFIGSQESICFLHNFIDTTLKYQSIDGVLSSTNFVSNNIITRLAKVIKNRDFQELFKKNKFLRIENEFTGLDLLSVKNWLIKNKGKYDLDQTYFF